MGNNNKGNLILEGLDPQQKAAVLQMDGRGTETPTDDVILDVFLRPAKF